MTEIASPSRQVLEELPARALKFLSALATHETIRAILEGRGFTLADHQEGWDLLHGAVGYKRTDGGAGITAVVNVAARDAIAELDAWDEPNFRIVRAALERRHPEQCAFVFAGDLGPAQGAGAVLSVATLLDRLDALEHGDDRKKTRKADHAALATLAARKVTAAERTRLRALVETVRNAAPAAAPPAAPAATAPTRDARSEALRALYAWYREWSETARGAIRRRDYLIQLGLASRKPARKTA